jgi:hypothetical protein
VLVRRRANLFGRWPKVNGGRCGVTQVTYGSFSLPRVTGGDYSCARREPFVDRRLLRVGGPRRPGRLSPRRTPGVPPRGDLGRDGARGGGDRSAPPGIPFRLKVRPTPGRLAVQQMVPHLRTSDGGKGAGVSPGDTRARLWGEGPLGARGPAPGVRKGYPFALDWYGGRTAVIRFPCPRQRIETGGPRKGPSSSRAISRRSIRASAGRRVGGEGRGRWRNGCGC